TRGAERAADDARYRRSRTAVRPCRDPRCWRDRRGRPTRRTRGVARPGRYARGRLCPADATRRRGSAVISALCRHCVLNIRLYFRNPLALTYGYLFPILFLVTFRALYRYDRVPLVGQIGELLTITVLGGACFGMPTTFATERELRLW